MNPVIGIGILVVAGVGFIVILVKLIREGITGWRRTNALANAPTVPIAEVSSRSDPLFKVKGRVVCDTPLGSNHSGTPCVYFLWRVVGFYRVRVHVRDSEGKSHYRMEVQSDLIVEESERIPFEIADGTGRIWIAPHEAEFHCDAVYRKCEPMSGGKYFERQSTEWALTPGMEVIAWGGVSNRRPGGKRGKKAGAKRLELGASVICDVDHEKTLLRKRWLGAISFVAVGVLGVSVLVFPAVYFLGFFMNWW